MIKYSFKYRWCWILRKYGWRYTLIGGLGATFYVSYFNTAMIFILILMLVIEVMISKSINMLVFPNTNMIAMINTIDKKLRFCLDFRYFITHLIIPKIHLAILKQSSILYPVGRHRKATTRIATSPSGLQVTPLFLLKRNNYVFK